MSTKKDTCRVAGIGVERGGREGCAVFCLCVHIADNPPKQKSVTRHKICAGARLIPEV